MEKRDWDWQRCDKLNCKIWRKKKIYIARRRYNGRFAKPHNLFTHFVPTLLCLNGYVKSLLYSCDHQNLMDDIL